MKLNGLVSIPGSKKPRLRKGRGISSGMGKTCGRGHKGQNSRSGGGVRPGFEGGQMPLYRRVPKRGFNNKLFAKVYAEINVSDLNSFDDGMIVNEELLRENKLVKGRYDGIAVLGNGEINKKLTVYASKFTRTAAEKIEAAGGKVEVV